MIRPLRATSFLFLGITVVASGLAMGACAHGTTLADGGSDDSFPAATGTGINEVTSAATAGQTNTVGATSTHAVGVISVTSGPSQVASSSSGSPVICGDAICNTQGGESCFTCPGDCSSLCCNMDGICNTASGETAINCPSDCAVATNCADPCVTGFGPEDQAACSGTANGTCVNDVCGEDPFCCDTLWDDACVSEAQDDFACSCI